MSNITKIPRKRLFVLYGSTPYTCVLVCWQCDGANNGNICTVFYQQDCRFHFIAHISLWIQLIRMRKISIYQIISEQIQVGFDFNPYQRVSLCLLSTMKSVRQKTGSSTDFCLCLCFYLVFAFFQCSSDSSRSRMGQSYAFQLRKYFNVIEPQWNLLIAQ